MEEQLEIHLIRSYDHFKRDRIYEYIRSKKGSKGIPITHRLIPIVTTNNEWLIWADSKRDINLTSSDHHKVYDTRNNTNTTVSNKEMNDNRLHLVIYKDIHVRLPCGDFVRVYSTGLFAYESDYVFCDLNIGYIQNRLSYQESYSQIDRCALLSNCGVYLVDHFLYFQTTRGSGELPSIMKWNLEELRKKVLGEDNSFKEEILYDSIVCQFVVEENHNVWVMKGSTIMHPVDKHKSFTLGNARKRLFSFAVCNKWVVAACVRYKDYSPLGFHSKCQKFESKETITQLKLLTRGLFQKSSISFETNIKSSNPFTSMYFFKSRSLGNVLSCVSGRSIYLFALRSGYLVKLVTKVVGEALILNGERWVCVFSRKTSSIVIKGEERIVCVSLDL